LLESTACTGLKQNIDSKIYANCKADLAKVQKTKQVFSQLKIVRFVRITKNCALNIKEWSKMQEKLKNLKTGQDFMDISK